LANDKGAALYWLLCHQREFPNTACVCDVNCCITWLEKKGKDFRVIGEGFKNFIGMLKT
jgi:hypothetical protein